MPAFPRVSTVGAIARLAHRSIVGLSLKGITVSTVGAIARLAHIAGRQESVHLILCQPLVRSPG